MLTALLAVVGAVAIPTSASAASGATAMRVKDINPGVGDAIAVDNPELTNLNGREWAVSSTGFALPGKGR
jgi:hypothetical protein